MARVVILGAGLTGISTAYHLEKSGYFDFALFEKESRIGGLCRSETVDGFTFDYTGHLLHASDPYFYDLIAHFVGIENMNEIDRKSYIYSHDTYTKYPFQINLHGLPPKIIIECISSYVSRTHNPHPTTFKEWVISQFGEGFGKHFFFDYQEKIFAHSIDKLTASWTGRFVPTTSLEDILWGSLTNRADKIGYNSQFLYPKDGGIQTWVHTFADQIKSPIHTNFNVKTIDLINNSVTFENGHEESYELLINTIPLDIFIEKTIEPSHTNVTSALSHLQCNKVVNFNLAIKRPNLSDKHWIYFPEKKYPFYRLGFWHNFSKKMAPEGCSSLYGEFAYKQRTKEWVYDTLDHALHAVKKLFSISDTELLFEKVFTIQHAYVTFDAWRDEHLPKLLKRLEEHNVISTGRYGGWKYSSMQEAVLDGKAAAETIIADAWKPTMFTKKSELMLE